MVTKSLRSNWGVLLLAAATAAVAQSPAPSTAPLAVPVQGLAIVPLNGQTQDQQWSDRYACHDWSKTQSGFDPSQSTAGVPPNEIASRREEYRRALTACLEARGYSVRAAAPPPPAPRANAAPLFVVHSDPPAPELKYHPLALQIGGGYTIPTGTSDQSLEGGANASLGFTWFPTSELPLGLRVDGSYSWFRAKNALLTQNGSYFTSGYQDLYGGDADAQLDLAHHSSRVKAYLFGGFGRYRTRTDLHQVSLVSGTLCYPGFCAPGTFPAVTAVERVTSPWYGAWNAGMGGEVALDQHTSLFIEARYLRLKPYTTKTEFIPITLGLRF